MAWITDKTANHEDSTLNDAKVKEILTGKSYVKTANDTYFITAKSEYEIPYSELYTSTEIVQSVPTPTDVYAASYGNGIIVLSNNSDDIDSSQLQSEIVKIFDHTVSYGDSPCHVANGLMNSDQVTKVIILNKIVPTSCVYLFRDCYNLTEIANIENLDTSLVTNMRGMFGTCELLVTDVSSFNTSNVTNMSYMFANGMNDDFSGASNITGYENFDMSNVTNMQGMFYDTQLNDAQKLAPVLTMCINATKISNENKTLNYLSLGSYRAGICQTLQNYQDFLNAGWTTGY